MTKTVATRYRREEVPVELTWKLEDLFPSTSAWEAEIASIEQELPTFSTYKGRLHESSSVILECLEKQERLTMKLVLVATYSNLLQSGDGTDPVNQGNASRIGNLRAKVDAALSFIQSEILEIPAQTLEAFIEAEDGLEPFENSLRDLIEGKKHQLSPETEEVLAALGEVHSAPYAIYQTSKLADMQFNSFIDDTGNELPNSFALFEDRYEFSPSTTTRRKAYDSFVGTLKQYKNTFATVFK